MNEILPTLFFVLFLSFVGYFVFRAFRFGGLKGAMFGARIERSLGEVTAERQGPVGTVVKVHILRRGADEKLVGLEFVAKSIASYGMMPVALQADQASRLAALLQQALSEP
jgi:hypothetical protein